MRVAVVGAGNGGHALAAALGLRGHAVTVFSRTVDTLQAIRAEGGIRITGILGEHLVKTNVTEDIRDALVDCDLAVLTVPGTFQEEYLRLALPHLAPPQALWLSPGNGGSLLAWQILAELEREPLLLIETATLAYVGRRTGPARVHSRAMARPHMATFPANRYAEAAAVIEQCCEVIEAKNVLESMLMNVNCVIHPLPAVLNWGWIEARDRSISLYGEGMSSGVLASVAALDGERYNVAERMGLNALRLDDIYRAQGMPPLYRMGMNIGAAERYEDRFILEDVPVGLITIADLGAQFGVPTPVANATIVLAGCIYGRDLRSEGRTARALGIDAMDLPRISAFLEAGPS